eukprot:gnl/TRDRNA2_/TRDRNA2_200297_c0_seq1.p1 gnl/TRDRNA2_/TRDRNA2_200297_c0~~gnl/TRDRNA2_/TRDRNA2_200297_c0_seq1.p1  ORF type:complete len:201 (+),score=10.85 gnl/TRDRNA2_/TRDRNA2_200297_c0_seq1:309-911(+)
MHRCWNSPHAPRVLLRKLYESGPGQGYETSGSCRLGPYGELLPAASLQLLKALSVCQHDTFCDLGSGLGKLVLLAAAATPAKRCLGIELHETRLAVARQALSRGEASGLVPAGRCTFRCDDLYSTELDDVTVVYCCSTAFPDAAMGRLSKRLAKLPQLRLWATLREPPHSQGFELLHRLRLDTSWKRRELVHIYAKRHQC